MQRQIPIIVTNKVSKKRHILFRVASPKLSDPNKSMQQQAKLTSITNVQDQNRTRTVSKREKSGPYTRARRISSSTAAKRFPKDFFRPQPCNESLLHKTQNEQTIEHANLFDTFSQRCLPVRKEDQNKSISSSKSQLTPKFKFLKQKQNSQIASVNQKQNSLKIDELPSLNQFCSLRDEVFQLDLVKKCTKKQQKMRQMKQITPQFSNFNVTLGQKINLAMLFKKDKERKKITKLKQKQNSFNLPLILNGVTIKRAEEGSRKSHKN